MIVKLMANPRSYLAAKKIYDPEHTHKIVAKTASTMQEVAAITLGPYGRNVLIQNEMQEPRITKDGVTVVKHIEFQENRLEDAVASLIKKSVDGTNKYAGDGTTTSTVLIGEIMKAAYKKIALGESIRDIRKGLEIGRKIGIEFMESCSRKISSREDLMKVAMISTNGKSAIANLVSEAVSRSSAVTVEKSQKAQNFLQFYSGIKITRGFDSSQFVNTGAGKVVYNYPLVVVSNQPLKNVKQVVKSLELAKRARKQLIFFAPDFSDGVRSTLIYNNKKKVVETACISVPPYGEKAKELLPKIAKMTEAHFFDQFSDTDIADLNWEDFGKAIKIQADQYQTKLEVKENQQRDSASCVIYVGGPNETVMLENYDHIIDALNSVTSAKKDGVVAGGGVSLWRLAELLEQYEGQGKMGVQILAQALKHPRRKLMQYIPTQKKPLSGSVWEGYDLKQEKIVDMFEAGVIDSVNVAKSTLIDSISLCNVLVEVDIGIVRVDPNISTVSLKELNKKYSI